MRIDFDDPKSPIVATEFVGTSISSYGPPHELIAQALPDNPHVKFFDSRVRGYVAVQVSPTKMDIQFRAISDVTNPEASVSTLKSFSVENGRPGVVT